MKRTKVIFSLIKIVYNNFKKLHYALILVSGVFKQNKKITIPKVKKT